MASLDLPLTHGTLGRRTLLAGVAAAAAVPARAAGPWTREAYVEAMRKSGRPVELNDAQFAAIQARKPGAIRRIESYLKERLGSADPAVIKAFQEVPREYYHYLYPEHRSQGGVAYEDDPKPWALGYGSALSDYLGQAYMTQVCKPQPGDLTLEVGTGSGFQSSLLSRIVKRSYSIEIIEPLGNAVSKIFAPLGYDNVETRVGDGYFGWPEVRGGFDIIIVTCAAQYAPPELFKQLKPGGRMLIPIGQPFKRGQILYVYTKDEDGKVHSKRDVGVFFIPMTGAMMNRPKPAGPDAAGAAPAPGARGSSRGGGAVGTSGAAEALGPPAGRRAWTMRDDFVRGFAVMLAATLLFSISDVMAKYVTVTVPPVELAVIRYAVFVVMAGAPFLRSRRVSMRSRRPGLQVLRGVGVAGSAICFILSLGTLPIAEATAINFVTPLLITVLAIPVLGETVRPQGWAAVLVGFLGMLIVVRPGLGGFHPAALLVLVSSLFWCMAMLITRQMAGLDRPEVTLLWTALTGFVLLLAALPFFLAPLTLKELGLCLAVGVVASSGQWCAVQAYRFARATALAPLTYVQLIWSSALGLLVFGTVPDRWVLAGAAVIAGSGVYLVRLERQRVTAAADAA